MPQTRTTTQKIIAVGLIVALCGACAAHHTPLATGVSPTSRSAACTLVPASAHLLDTITIALTHGVDPSHAPVPENESERVLFAQLYEPLIRVDCVGQPYLALAASWRVDSSGRRWTFTLRDDASFWDGTPVTARDVAASWAARRPLRDANDVDGRTAFTAVRAESVLVDDARTLTVVLRDAQRTVPLWLASPELAVAKSTPGASWPQGTGAYRVDQADDAPGGGAQHDAIALRASSAAHAPVLQFRTRSGMDARDLLDNGIDVLRTNAPAVLDYAATRQDFSSSPLPWDRTYVLLSPARDGLSGVHADSTFRDALARDAVRGDARGSEGPYWWDDTSACTEAMTARSTPTSVGMRRIVYPRGDRVARDLADRLVALAALDSSSAPRAAMLASLVPGIAARDARVIAAGLPPAEFTAELGRGRDLAYVLPVPRRALAPCEQARSLIAAIGWALPGIDRNVVPPSSTSAATLPALGRALVPLIDTRSSLIVRRGVGNVVVDWDGTPVFATAPVSATAPRLAPPSSQHRP
ncbi:MAG TPA: ABC transporter substrate-binding protein [Gemmatimonadaceae bacterium]